MKLIAVNVNFVYEELLIGQLSNRVVVPRMYGSFVGVDKLELELIAVNVNSDL